MQAVWKRQEKGWETSQPKGIGWHAGTLTFSLLIFCSNLSSETAWASAVLSPVLPEAAGHYHYALWQSHSPEWLPGKTTNIIYLVSLHKFIPSTKGWMSTITKSPCIWFTWAHKSAVCLAQILVGKISLQISRLLLFLSVLRVLFDYNSHQT